MEEVDPIVVYLDSSDYSALSDPKRSSKTDEIRAQLVELAAARGVIFAFSGIHISEMAPLEPKYTDAAAARTDLMVQLCGRNAFLSHDRLFKLELGRLLAGDGTSAHALTHDGTWFPDLGGISTPAQVIDATAAIDEKGVELGLNRQQRRLLKSKASRHGKFRSQFVKGMGGFDLTEILDRYPMRPQDAHVITDYVLGKADAKQADAAFLESLRDPRWMMRWFHEHHDRLGPVGDWARAPAIKMMTALSEMVEAGNRLLHFEKETGIQTGVDFLDAARWQAQSEQLIRSVVNRLLQSEHPGTPSCDDIVAINRYCPGISSLVGVAHASLKNSFGPNARKLARSDFVDAMHAMYAPYVHVFRADRYMAPIIKRCAERHGTLVAETLEKTPSAIQSVMP